MQDHEKDMSDPNNDKQLRIFITEEERTSTDLAVLSNIMANRLKELSYVIAENKGVVVTNNAIADLGLFDAVLHGHSRIIFFLHCFL